MKSLVVLLAALLSGCYNWSEVRIHDPLEKVRWVKAPIEVVQSIPGCEDPRIFACAVNFNNEICLVFATTTKAETPQWVIDHEEKHCQGFSHEKDNKK